MCRRQRVYLSLEIFLEQGKWKENFQNRTRPKAAHAHLSKDKTHPCLPQTKRILVKSWLKLQDMSFLSEQEQNKPTSGILQLAYHLVCDSFSQILIYLLFIKSLYMKQCWHYHYPQKDEETKAEIFWVGKYTWATWLPRQRDTKWLLELWVRSNFPLWH